MPARRSQPESGPLLATRLPTPSRPLHASWAQPPLHGACDFAAGARVGPHPPLIGPGEGSPGFDEPGSVGVALVSRQRNGGGASRPSHPRYR